MYKKIIGALVVALAATCWMVAQYAVGQPAVAPVNDHILPPLTNPVEQRSSSLTGSAWQANSPYVAQAPTVMSGSTTGLLTPADAPANPADMPMPPIPPAPPQQEQPRNVPITTPALAGFPNLPQVPNTPPTPPLFLVNSREVTDSGSTGATQAPVNQPATSATGVVATNGNIALNQVCRQEPIIWGAVEYLLWYARSAQAPTLLQASIGSNPAVPLYPSGNGINYNPMSGFRGILGFWLNDEQSLGVETTYFWFGEDTRLSSYQGGGNLALGHPFTDAVNGNVGIEPVATTSGLSGTSIVRSGMQINGGDSSLLIDPGLGNFSVLLGFRYLDLEEFLNINDSSAGAGPTLSASDSFRTRNQFFGAQTGIRYAWTGETLTFSFSGKISYGALNETVGIEGYSTQTTAAGTTARTGGIYALNSNIGSYSQTTTAVIPEFTAKLGWRITPWATATIGYNFLYISQVVRPGSQIDSTINPTNFPYGTATGSTVPRPSFAFHNESFWMQGVNFGMTFQY
jgi:hypothetical protein